MKNFILICFALFYTLCSYSNNAFWQDADPNTITLKGERMILANSYRTVKLNKDGFFVFRNSIPLEMNVSVRNSGTIFTLPMPNGTMARFKVVESPVMEQGLADKFPDIKTYLGQGIDDPYATVRFDYTMHGFHAMILSPNGTVFIDPFTMNETDYYIVYYKHDFYPAVDKNFICHTETDNAAPNYNKIFSSTGEQLRTYRLAVAATGEYTAFFGGTVAGGLAAIVTSVNRITGVYESDLSVRLQLIANNNLIVYTNAATDPYTNNNGSTLLTQNQSNLDNVIGSANYDIGHVYSTGSFGGIAGLRVVCVNGQKARGATGSTNPQGDPWDIDYVSHEMGHQFGGNHTQNNSSCNANPPTAWEPGSGITIMGYAGVCSPSLANNSIPFFHGGNIFQEMIPYTQSGNGNNCPQITNTGNLPPAVTVPTGGFTIPISTYFSLTGSATDGNNDPLTYSWEQMDVGPQGNPNNPVGNAPLFRPFPAVTNGTRLFPKLSDILNNTQTLGELLPTYSRNLNFRMTVRDNRAGGGGISYGDISFSVTNTAGPFLVTFPNTNVTIGGAQTITWNVANTNNAPVNCSNVKISLSTDGGTTWPTVLAANTANDGSEQIILPEINNTTARIKVEAVGNIFFDISNTNFTVTTTTGIQNQTGTPVEFGLSQNFPNPFNPVTILNYGIPKRSNVTLEVFDVTGKLVSTIVNNLFQTEGYYSIEFDASNLPSGVYYYRITAGEFIDSKKMILVK
jgi:hypothetical protein